MKKLLINTVAGCITLCATISAGNEISDPVFGGEIRIAINSDIRSTNPGVRRDGNTDTVLYHIGESLVGYRDDLSVAPLLADEITLSDDRKHYTFHLRRGISFHNGAAMTAQDVHWTWQRLLNPVTGFRCLEHYDGTGPIGLKIENIEIIDQYTITFTLNKPSALFLNRMASVQCQTPILHRDSVNADGSWRAPIGTGPYKLEQWRRGQQVSVVRFDNYTPRTEPKNGMTGAKIAYADRLVFTVVPDRFAAKSSVYSGNIDLVFAVPLSTHKELTRRIQKKNDIKLSRQDTLDWTVLLMQTQDPLLSNTKIRRAIAHAISPELVTAFSTFGLARPNTSAVQTLSPYHNAAHTTWFEYNPDLAKQLATEAGYRGQPLTIQTNRKFSYMFDNAVALQAMLNDAGFQVDIEVFDWATQLTNFFSGNFQLSSFGYSARSHPALLYGNFTGPKTIRKSYQWDNPIAFGLIKQLESVTDKHLVQSVLDSLHREMAATVPMIGLYNDHIMDVSVSTLYGYQTWAFGRPRLWGVWKKPINGNDQR